MNIKATPKLFKDINSQPNVIRQDENPSEVRMIT